MKVEYQSRPFFVESNLDGQAFDFNAPLAAKMITVEIRYHTRSRLDISFRHKGHTIATNIIPAASHFYKFHCETEYSASSGNRSCAYFVLSKRQGLSALESHIKNCVKHVFQINDNDEFTIVIWESKPILDLKETTTVLNCF